MNVEYSHVEWVVWSLRLSLSPAHTVLFPSAQAEMHIQSILKNTVFQSDLWTVLMHG